MTPKGEMKGRTLMMPEGSRKVCVMNGSRQLDKVIGGEWVTLKVLPEAGLPKGIYQLAQAERPPVDKGLTRFAGQVLQVDYEKVYQLHDKGIVVHDRSVFRDLEAKAGPLKEGQRVAVDYQHGRGAVVDTPGLKPAKARERGGGAEL